MASWDYPFKSNSSAFYEGIDVLNRQLLLNLWNAIYLEKHGVMKHKLLFDLWRSTPYDRVWFNDGNVSHRCVNMNTSRHSINASKSMLSPSDCFLPHKCRHEWFGVYLEERKDMKHCRAIIHAEYLKKTMRDYLVVNLRNNERMSPVHRG